MTPDPRLRRLGPTRGRKSLKNWSKRGLRKSLNGFRLAGAASSVLILTTVGPTRSTAWTTGVRRLVFSCANRCDAHNTTDTQTIRTRNKVENRNCFMRDGTGGSKCARFKTKRKVRASPSRTPRDYFTFTAIKMVDPPRRTRNSAERPCLMLLVRRL